MVWRDMVWPAYGPPLQEDDPGGCREGLADVHEYRIEVSSVSEPGPAIEARDLLRRLYGEPDTHGTSSPHVVRPRRLRGTVLPESGDEKEYGHVLGTVDYRYWASLKLGYIENVRVGPNMRRQGLGLRLVDFALEYMLGKGIRRVYSFAVTPEGSLLLESAGFAPEPPED
jgi:GNAT superfamily N-acetyltransferase